MSKIRAIFAVLLLSFLTVSTAFAQVPPIFPPNTVFGRLGGGMPGPGTALTFAELSANLNSTPAGSATLFGNPGASAAPSTNFTIQGLSIDSTPDANNDYVPIYNHITGTIQAVTPGEIATVATAGVSSLNTKTGALTLLTMPQGRITLTANTPVMIATASAQTTLRYDCYAGNQVPYYTGSADSVDTIASCEVTDAMVSGAAAGQVVSANVYDVWWVHAGPGICLAMSSASGGGGGWSADTGGSNTARGTGFSQLDNHTRPYVTNAQAISNCFNGSSNYGPVSGNRATYLGTVYASANGQISWTLGASASGGTAALLGVWNYYNRVNVVTTVTDSGATYPYSTTTIRQARASAGNQIQFVLGVQEDGLQFSYNAEIANAAAGSTTWGVGFDSTTAYGVQFSYYGAPSLTSAIPNTGVWSVGIGLHTLAALEATPTGSATMDNGSLNALMAMLRM